MKDASQGVSLLHLSIQEQRALIHTAIGCARVVFNHFLEKWNQVYLEAGNWLTYNACTNGLLPLKRLLKDYVCWELPTQLRELQGSLAPKEKVISLFARIRHLFR